MIKYIYFFAFTLLFVGEMFSQKTIIDNEIIKESCECISKIDQELDKINKNDSIKSCITQSIVSDQSKKFLADMLKISDTLKVINNDRIKIVNNKEYKIIVDENYEEIQGKLMLDCPYLKALIAINNEKHKNSVSDKKKAQEFYKEGEKYFNKQQIELALVEFSKAVKKDSKFAFAWDNLGICYRKLNRYNEAINCYQKSLKLDSKGKVPLMNLAVAYNLSKDNKKSIETYKKYIELHPEDPEGFYGVSRIQNFTNDYENALENALKAYEIYKKISSPYAQEALDVMREIIQNLKKENKIKIFNDFAEKHGIEKINE